MLPAGPGWRNIGTIVVTAALLVSCFGTVVAVAPAGGPDERSAGIDGSAPEAGVVHPDLEDAEGEVTVVVRFPELGTERAHDQSRRERGMQMRSHATDTQAAFEEFVEDHQAVGVDRSFWVANAKLVTVDTDSVALEELAAVEGVREIHPNYRIESTAATAAGTAAAGSGAARASSATAAPNSTGSTADGHATTYGLEQIRAPEVWERFGTRGAGVSVAVLDTGVDPSHPDVDVDESRWAEFDDAGDRVGSTPYDSGTHGTHTSGTVVGGDASGTQIGVAPDATLYHGKVLHEGTGTWAAATAGIEWAATEAEVDVVSMSLGGETYYPAFVEPIRRANDLGVVVVASAGNTGEGSSNSPGNVYDTIAVGAVDGDRNVEGFSSGERVDTAADWGSAAPDDWPDEYVVPNVAAPGASVWSAEPGGGYGYKSGTSMAAPHVAGTVALVRAAGGDHLTQSEMRDLLERTASKPAGEPDGMDTRYGAGVVDAYAATARGAADSTVTGQVVDGDGTPVSDSRVDTEFGYGAETDANGTFSLDVPSLEQTLTVRGYGHEPETVAVAPDSETVERDLVLTEPTLAARAESTPPERSDPGETLTYEFAVSNVTSVTVEELDGTAIEQGETTLRVEGREVAFGEERTFAEPQTNAEVTVEVETTAGAVGALELEYAFADGESSVTRSTPRTHVHPDPISLPADFDPADLQTAVDVVAPDTTVVVDERPAGPYVLSVDDDADATSGLSIAGPLTIEAAEGASPTFAVADHDAATDVTAVESTASGVSFAGITVEGNGADVGFRATEPASVADATVRNATVDFELGAETRVRNATLEGRTVDFDARDVTVSATGTPAAAPERHEFLGGAYDVEAVGASPRVDLSVGYDGADADRLQEETFRFSRYDGSSGEWTTVEDSRVETSDRRIVASLDPFGTVAAMGERRPAEFVVDRVDAQPDVVAGEELTVNATVTNAGVQSATRDVELTFDGEAVAAAPLTLAEGETGRVSLAHVVDESRDGGTASLGVATDADANLTTVEVVEPARFAVGDLEAPGAAERGDVLVVNGTVENTGDFDDEQRLELRLGTDVASETAGDYDVLATDARTLAAGESANVSFAVAVPLDADTGTLEIGLFSEDADARAPIDVSRISGTLEGKLADAATLDPVAGATVTATDAETGERFATTTDGTGAYDLALPVGEYTVAASADGYETTGGTAVEVADDETTAADLRIDRLPVYFDVSSVEAPANAEAGTAFDVAATVANLGSETGERTVELRVDGSAVAEETLTLEADAERSVAFTYAVETSGTVDVVVASPDDAATNRIEIETKETDDGNSGGGGSTGGGGGGSGGSIGGGGSAPPPEDGDGEDGDEETDDSTAVPDGDRETAAIVDADLDRPGVSVPLRNTSVSEITFRDEDAAGSLTVREGVDDDLAAPPGTPVAQLEIEVPAGLAGRPATIRSTVDPGTVGDGDLTMYRHADGDWRPLETTVTTTDGGLVVDAETPGFSRFALVRTGATSTPSGSGPAPDDTPTTTGSPTRATAETPTPTGASATDEAASPTQDDGAGFGIGAGLLAMLAGLLAARRSTR